jgi:hypothetical protein
MAAKAKQTREKKQEEPITTEQTQSESLGSEEPASGDFENAGAVDSLSPDFLELALTLQGLGKDKVQELVRKYAPRTVQARTRPYELVHILHSCREYY